MSYGNPEGLAETENACSLEGRGVTIGTSRCLPSVLIGSYSSGVAGPIRNLRSVMFGHCDVNAAAMAGVKW